jgi:copper(I)-binding protein
VDLKRRSYDAENRPRIWPVARFEIPAGGSLRLFHDGPFFLASGLDPKLAAGDHLPLTFTFEDEAPVTLDLTLEATVSASAGSTPAR